MKHRLRAAVLLVLSGWAPLVFVATATPPKESTTVSNNLQHRIKWVENNLSSPLERKHGAKPHTIKEELKRHKVPGVSVAVICEGKVDWAKGYGVVEAGKRNPVTPETLFQAASISKPFSALAALRLVRDGKLAFDDEVNDVLTEWKIPKSDLGTVTLRQLLSHRGGLTVHGFPGYKVGAPLPTVKQILNGEAPANTPAIVIEKMPGKCLARSFNIPAVVTPCCNCF